MTQHMPTNDSDLDRKRCARVSSAWNAQLLHTKKEAR